VAHIVFRTHFVQYSTVKMPRKPKKTVSEIYETLKELRFFHKNKFYLLDGAMSKSYVYMYITQNRNGILDKLYGKEIELSPQKISKNVSKNESDSSIHSNWSMNELNTLAPLRAKVHISKYDWEKIDPHIVSYKNREYEVLKTGWTDIIYEHIWKEIKIPCAFHFKNAKISRIPGDIFLKIKGKCSECNTEINIYSITEPAAEGIYLHVSTYDTRDIVHTKKRQLRGNKRKCVVKDLYEKSTYQWRRDKANELMEFGDLEPAHLYSENVLRKAKQLDRDKKLGVSKIKDPISSLIQLKYSLEFAGCIQQIGIDKFYTMYWSPEQVFLFKQFMKKDEICSISIDATGSLIKPLPKPDGSKAVIFLYQAVTAINGKILPLFQMISEKHDTNILTYWIREWLRSGVPCPKQVVTDYSLALLNAVTLSFNNTDLRTYINNCMNMLLVPMHKSLITCVIRIDIAHLIKAVCRWPCFVHIPASVKDFFVRCVGILSKCTTINDFSRICTDVLSVAFTSLEDVEDINNHCYSAQRRLFEIIKTDIKTCNVTESDLLMKFEDYEDDTINTSDSEIDKFLYRIERNSKKENDGTRPNPYYCPDFGTRLLKLCKHFVLWSAVMSKVNKNIAFYRNENTVASSARSEEYFREIKCLIFKGAKSNRIDKFIILHLRSLAGTMKLLNTPNFLQRESKYSQRTLTEKKIMLSYNSDLNKSDIDNTDQDISNTDPVLLSQNGSNYDSDTNDNTDTNDCNLMRENTQIIKNEKNSQIECDESPTINNINSFLNEIESWKGLNKIRKRRGKYLSACPDIEILHKRSKISRSAPLLINGNSLPPAKIGNKYISIKNTCPFDATVQCIIGGYRDWPEYQKYVNELCNPTFTLVKHLCNAGVTQKTYNVRAAIMSHIVTLKDGVLDCAMNASSLISMNLMHNVPSLEFTHQCEDCGLQKKHITPVLNVNTIPFYKEGIKGLQEAIGQCCKITNYVCSCCESTKVNSSWKSYINRYRMS